MTTFPAGGLRRRPCWTQAVVCVLRRPRDNPPLRAWNPGHYSLAYIFTSVCPLPLEVILLDVLAMVALAIGQPEQPLLEDGVLAVPERQRETQDLVAVADPGQVVLPPAVCAGARLIMGQIVPGVAGVAIILPHRLPLPLAEIGAPLAPWPMTLPRLLQTLVLGRARHSLAS